MEINAKSQWIIVFCIAGLIFAFSCTRQTNDTFKDWRNVNIDSLERVLATHSLSDIQLMKIHSNLALGYQPVNSEKSIFHARQGIIYADKVNDQYRKGLLYVYTGTSYDDIGKNDSAMFYFNKALDQLQFIDKNNVHDIDDLKSRIYGSLGNLNNAQGNYREALKYYLMMLELLEKHQWKNNTIRLYNNIGEIYMNLDNYEEAEKYYLKMETLAKELNDKPEIAFGLFQMGRIYLHFHKDYSKALENATSACKMMEVDSGATIDDKAGPLLLLSEIYLDGYNDYANAEKQASLVLKYGKELDSPYYISVALYRLSNVYLHEKLYRESEQAALKALKADSTYNIQLFNILAKTNAFLGKPAKAAEYLDRYTDLTSKLSNKNYMSALTEMQTKYETQKKELEIERQQQVISRQNTQRVLFVAGIAVCMIILALLWYMLRLRSRRNRALSERNDALTEMNATKDKFFSIISHDLRNPAIAQRDALQIARSKRQLMGCQQTDVVLPRPPEIGRRTGRTPVQSAGLGADSDRTNNLQPRNIYPFRLACRPCFCS